MESAEALAHKKDDRLRKEFEKWAVLSYTNNRGVINEKKGADAGIDARAFFKTGRVDNAKIIFQVKSGGVKRGDIATLRGDMQREGAAMATLITLEEPTKQMIAEAKGAGPYRHEEMGRSYDKISIVTIKEIVEQGKRLEIPMSLEVLAAAQRQEEDIQLPLSALVKPNAPKAKHAKQTVKSLFSYPDGAEELDEDEDMVEEISHVPAEE
jgi:site-specific DNA-methyltransferase (adenine-specific)